MLIAGAERNCADSSLLGQRSTAGSTQRRQQQLLLLRSAAAKLYASSSSFRLGSANNAVEIIDAPPVRRR